MKHITAESKSLTENTTALKPEKTLTVSRAAKFFVDSGFEDTDRMLAEQMIREGIRKTHDAAESFRGKGKYLGHAHWSRQALMLLADNGGTEKGITDSLSHEHVIPVSYIVKDILFKNPPGTKIEIYRGQIDEFSVVAIVTRAEHEKLTNAKLGSTMPCGWEEIGLWARYIQAELMDDILSG